MFRFAAAAAAMVLCVSGTARAQSFDDFMSMCGSTDVDATAVREAAGKLGWIGLPESLVKTMGTDPDAEMPFQPVFVMAAPDNQVGLLAFATAQMPLGERTVPAEMCMLITQSIPATSAHQGFKGLNLAEMRESDDQEGSYMAFSRTSAGVRDEGDLSEATDEEMVAVLQDRPVYLMGYIPGEQTILIKARVSSAGAQ